ncbi:unnamed protein product [Sphagnum balticum]
MQTDRVGGAVKVVATFTSLTNEDYERGAAMRKLRVSGNVVQSKAEMGADLFEGDIIMSGTERAAVTSAQLLWDRNEVPGADQQ